MEQKEEDVKSMLNQFGWGIDELQKKGLVEIVYEDAASMKEKVKDQGRLIDVITKEDYQRIVFDSLSMVTHAFDLDTEKRKYLMQMIGAIKKSKATSILIAEANENGQVPANLAMTEYLCDGVIKLMYLREGTTRIRALEVAKMRGINHFKKTTPMRITSHGVFTYPQEDIYAIIGR